MVLEYMLPNMSLGRCLCYPNYLSEAASLSVLPRGGAGPVLPNTDSHLANDGIHFWPTIYLRVPVINLVETEPGVLVQALRPEWCNPAKLFRNVGDAA